MSIKSLNGRIEASFCNEYLEWEMFEIKIERK
jgi:hypothetical protein